MSLVAVFDFVVLVGRGAKKLSPALSSTPDMMGSPLEANCCALANQRALAEEIVETDAADEAEPVCRKRNKP